MKKKAISKEEELSFLVLKSETMWFLGNFQESLQLADRVLKESVEVANLFLQLDALIQKSWSLYWTARVTESIQTAEKGLTMLATATNLPATTIAERKAQLLLRKGAGVGQLGDNKKSIELAQEALSFAEKSGNKRIISLCLAVLGAWYFMDGNHEKSEELWEKVLTIATELGNKFLIAWSYIGFAYLKRRRREFEQAIDLFNKAFALANEIGSTLFLPYKHDLGLVYRDMFQLDKALECYQKALKVSSRPYIMLANIGYIYFLKYELKQAQEYYLKAMNICEEIQDRRILPRVLYNLISISIELKNLPQAQDYLERLEQISIETGFERIGRLYRFASIMLLKASGNIGDLAEAAGLLKAFLKEEDLPAAYRVDALFHLSEIHLKELQLTADREVLEKVRNDITNLQREAEARNYFWLLINIHRLKSQLALLAFDVKKAVEWLVTARTLAEDKGLDILVQGILQEQEKLESQLGMWMKFKEESAPLVETLKQVPLENTIKQTARETVMEVRDGETGKTIEYRKLFALRI